jgi:hypothetical protein
MLKSTLILALFSTSVGLAHAGDIAKGKELVEPAIALLAMALA